MPGCKVDRNAANPPDREGGGKNSSAHAKDFGWESQDSRGTGEGGAGLNPAYAIMPTV